MNQPGDDLSTARSSAGNDAAVAAAAAAAAAAAFRGVSAFPLTPLIDGGLGGIDEAAFIGLVSRCAEAGAASIGVLGSTGSYMYLSAEERARAIELAVEHAAGVPVIACIGAISTREVLSHLAAAERLGAAGVMLPAVTYQALSDGEVFELFREVTQAATVPVLVYDNPGTTGVTFSLSLYERVAALPGIASIKIPPTAGEHASLADRVAAIRAVVPEHVTIGISGDHAAREGLAAGCDAWYSVIAGVLPERALAVAAGEAGERFDELVGLMPKFGGSLRVGAAAAEALGLIGADALPRPVLGLAPERKRHVQRLVRVIAAADALRAQAPNDRLAAALGAGTHPAPGLLAELTARFGVEPVFEVREMLTWATLRQAEAEGDPAVREAVLGQLRLPNPQARAQALHTLTKIADASVWQSIDESMLHARDDEEARTAWRAAAELWPREEHGRLAAELVRELGRGDLAMMRSLARAFALLGDAARSALGGALTAAGSRVRAHAEAALRVLDDPAATFYVDGE